MYPVVGIIDPFLNLRGKVSGITRDHPKGIIPVDVAYNTFDLLYQNRTSFLPLTRDVKMNLNRG
jgi:hypothetical protein